MQEGSEGLGLMQWLRGGQAAVSRAMYETARRRLAVRCLTPQESKISNFHFVSIILRETGY